MAAGMLFQPVPWSVNTKRGCPPQYEQFLDSPSHVVINVPPNFMFQSKIFKPSRLCTIYKHVRCAPSTWGMSAMLLSCSSPDGKFRCLLAGLIRDLELREQMHVWHGAADLL